MDAGGTPDGLIYHAAGEQDDGRWQADEMAEAGPPPSESFEAKHVIQP